MCVLGCLIYLCLIRCLFVSSVAGVLRFEGALACGMYLYEWVIVCLSGCVFVGLCACMLMYLNVSVRLSALA